MVFGAWELKCFGIMATRRPKKRRCGHKANQLEVAKQYCRRYDDLQGFEVRFIADYIGEGVFTTKTFSDGDFLLEYKGELITNYQKATRMEKEYEEADQGCFMFYFKYKEKKMCVDATTDIFSEGRMVNDAKKGDALQNCALKIVDVDGIPHLCIFATRDISLDEELRYDYGVDNLPWRKKSNLKPKDASIADEGDGQESDTNKTPVHNDKGDRCKGAANDPGTPETSIVNEVGDKESDTYKPAVNNGIGDRCKGENDDQGTPDACIADEGDDRKSDTDEIAINNYKEDRCHGAAYDHGTPNACIADDGDDQESDTDETTVSNDKGDICMGAANDPGTPETSIANEVGDKESDTYKPAVNNDIGDRCKGENDDQGTPDACIADEGDDRKSDTNEIAINNYKEDRCHGAAYDHCTPNACIADDIDDQESDTDETTVSNDKGDRCNGAANDPGTPETSIANEVGDKESDTYKPAVNNDIGDRCKGAANDPGTPETIIANEVVDNESDTYKPAVNNDKGDRCKGENDDQGTPGACIADEGDDRKSDTDEIAINDYKEDRCHGAAYDHGTPNACIADDGDDQESDTDETTVSNDKADAESVRVKQCLGLVEIDLKETPRANTVTHAEIDYNSHIFQDTTCKPREIELPITSMNLYIEDDDDDDDVDEDNEDDGDADYVPVNTNDESDCSDEEDEIEDDNTEDEIEDDNTDAQGKHIYADQAYMRQMAKVTIPEYNEKEGGKRDYRKTNYCLVCKRSFTSKISAHYINIHYNHEKVKRAMLCPTGSKERKIALLELENRGNFVHNVAVIQEGEGELVVARRPSGKNKNTYAAENFLPCEFCLGFYMKDTLWLHINSCLLKPKEKQPSANYVRDAKVMLTPFLPDITEEDAQLESFFNGMKETTANPGIPCICKNDLLIKEFSKSMLLRLGEKSEQRIKDIDNVRTKVRTVGRLLKELNETKEAAIPLSDYITGRNFGLVTNATKSLALKSDSPQVALTLGHYIKHVALLKISVGIQEDNSDYVKEGRNFQELYQCHWNSRVSSVAKRRQQLRHINKESKLPLTKDLIALKNWTQHELKRSIKNKSPDESLLTRLARLCIVRIAMFNKRRIAEVAEMTVSDFVSVEENDEIDSEIYNSLDMSEKILSKRMKVIEVRGKSVRGLRKVCILLTPDMIEALEYLLRKRNNTSPFLFSRKSDNTPIDGCTAMRLITQECPGLEKPKRIRTREMRKYLATTSQILDMTSPELKMLADHMGHNIDVHTDVYRLQSSILEKTKVARVLIAMENGNVHKFQGKRLQDISINDIPEPLCDAWQLQTDAEEKETGVEEDVDDTIVTTNTDMPMETEESPDDRTAQRGTKCKSDTGNLPKIQRVRWTEEENKLFRETMHEDIANKTMPPGSLVIDLSKKLPKRTASQIRTKMHNIITGKLKKY